MFKTSETATFVRVPGPVAVWKYFDQKGLPGDQMAAAVRIIMTENGSERDVRENMYRTVVWPPLNPLNVALPETVRNGFKDIKLPSISLIYNNNIVFLSLPVRAPYCLRAGTINYRNCSNCPTIG